MKNIKVQDQTFEFIKSLAKELKTQDNRGTANPRFYQVASLQRQHGFASGYADEYVWRDDEDNTYESLEGLRNYLIDCEDFPATEELTEDKASALGFEKIGVKGVSFYQNCFLTEKACEKHIKQNAYHYNTPRSYLSYAFRNPELEALISAIIEIADCP